MNQYKSTRLFSFYDYDQLLDNHDPKKAIHTEFGEFRRNYLEMFFYYLHATYLAPGAIAEGQPPLQIDTDKLNYDAFTEYRFSAVFNVLDFLPYLDQETLFKMFANLIDEHEQLNQIVSSEQKVNLNDLMNALRSEEIQSLQNTQVGALVVSALKDIQDTVFDVFQSLRSLLVKATLIVLLDDYHEGIDPISGKNYVDLIEIDADAVRAISTFEDRMKDLEVEHQAAVVTARQEKLRTATQESIRRAMLGEDYAGELPKEGSTFQNPEIYMCNSMSVDGPSERTKAEFIQEIKEKATLAGQETISIMYEDSLCVVELAEDGLVDIAFLMTRPWNRHVPDADLPPNVIRVSDWNEIDLCLNWLLPSADQRTDEYSISDRVQNLEEMKAVLYQSRQAS